MSVDGDLHGTNVTLLCENITCNQRIDFETDYDVASDGIIGDGELVKPEEIRPYLWEAFKDNNYKVPDNTHMAGWEYNILLSLERGVKIDGS